MSTEETKTRIATQKALAKFAERFGIDENEISKLLGQSYQRKLKNRGTPVSEFVKFKFKTLPEDEETSNQDIAGFIKDILDRKVNDDILTCRNVAEYKAFMRFLTLLPELRDDVLNSHQTYLSKYPAINETTFGIFERLYAESEELWKKGEVTPAMVLSPAIRDNAKCPVQIHCYTQRNGDVLITTEKKEWKGTHYANEACPKSNGGCATSIVITALVAMLAFVFGCSSDNEAVEPTGQYIFCNDTLTVAVRFDIKGLYHENKNEKSAAVCIFLRNKMEYQNGGYTNYTGEYPEYTIIAKDNEHLMTTVLVMSCRFSSVKAFDATVTMQELSDIYWGYGHSHIYLPKSMTFKKDDTVLDKNGDGVLDSSQGF